MLKRFIQLILFAVVAFVAVRAFQDWQSSRTVAGPVVQPDITGGSSDPASADYATDRTRQMEAESRAIQQKLEQLQSTPMTDAERERAARDLLEQQRRLVEQGQNPPG